MFSAPSARTRLRRQVPLRQRRDHEAILQGVHRRVLGRTVGLDQQPGQDMGGGRVDARHAGRQGAAPAGRHQHGVALGGAGAALAQDGESVVPQVHQRQRVQPAAGVGHGQHHGPALRSSQAVPRSMSGLAQGRRRRPGAGRARSVGVGRRVLRGMGGLASRQIHDQQRVEVQIAFHRGLVRGLGGGRGRVGAGARRRQGWPDGGQGQGQDQRGNAAHRRSNGLAGFAGNGTSPAIVQNPRKPGSGRQIAGLRMAGLAMPARAQVAQLARRARRIHSRDSSG